MRGPKSYPGQLLSQAHHLATKESKRPQQVSLRRAVSTAYYALFHFLIDECCRIWIGAGPPAHTIRTTLARAFEHGRMAKACEAFNVPILAGQPFKGKFAQSGIAVPQELRTIARTFLRLQERRHQADYDRTFQLDRQNVLSLINQVEQALSNWERIRNEPAVRLFLLSLLFWERMSKDVH
jgi:uncharacterized protein (UPF0332 family)